ncbi:hypothetical protein TNCV_3314391 [Trichonephila clavipes]|nr:hypothetical protein TNCV_3314391 [Trichonephila clavipes]
MTRFVSKSPGVAEHCDVNLHSPKELSSSSLSNRNLLCALFVDYDILTFMTSSLVVMVKLEPGVSKVQVLVPLKNCSEEEPLYVKCPLHACFGKMWKFGMDGASSGVIYVI